MILFGKGKAGRMTDLPSDRLKQLIEFQSQINIRFKSLEILNNALVHRSFINEQIAVRSNNERLEFLGDSVLGLIISSYLYQVLTDRPEGDLAKIKSFVVSEEILSEVALNLGLDQMLLIGKGEEISGGRKKKAILADGLEAVIGAYYLDSGFKPCEDFVLRLLVPHINKVLENRHKKDYKTLLQELVQKSYKNYPRYILVEKSGPEHDRVFTIEVEIMGKICGKGQGHNKKEAEQAAAAIAYRSMVPEDSD